MSRGDRAADRSASGDERAMTRDPLDGRAYFSCPRRGCYRVVRRLTEIRMLEGLTEHESEFVCDECLDELDERTAGDPLLALERTGRARP